MKCKDCVNEMLPGGLTSGPVCAHCLGYLGPIVIILLVAAVLWFFIRFAH